ncbi:molybdopterin-synthase adenylyltransferase MoeB [Flavicella sediminum]|uniref:molybdopterin-synthase adenylyltransferase MoeB n=1 Tax=Flavicella sediminum TaxID=2585141 RepID=UPI001122C235|nr:molybdopterin-synthase adenylyltransferase MoeB [Flavicella sediminum]
MFSSEEKKQYNRHFILSEIGISGQEKLKNAKVLVVGAGGLGCPILQYLTAAGVGTIGIIDNDVVAQSNLQRQILFTTNDIGKPKVICAKERLQQTNPFVTFKTHQSYLNSDNALALFNQYDVIVDGSDNFQTRYLTNDAAVLCNKPLVFGAIFKFEGQVSVFNYKNGPSYRCLFPEPPKANSIPNCSDIGVLGVLPGIIGCYQANEVLKIICGIGEVLSGKLLSLNTLNLQQNILNFKKNPSIIVEKLIDYDFFCGIENNDSIEISTKQLKEKLAFEKVQLIDVRKLMERENLNIGGLHIPLHELHQKLEELKNLDHLIFYCEVGQRSLIATKIFLEKYPNKNAKSLTGGLQAWLKE